MNTSSWKASKSHLCQKKKYFKYFHFKPDKSQPQAIQKYRHLGRNLYMEPDKNVKFKEKLQMDLEL